MIGCIPHLPDQMDPRKGETRGPVQHEMSGCVHTIDGASSGATALD